MIISQWMTGCIITGALVLSLLSGAACFVFERCRIDLSVIDTQLNPGNPTILFDDSGREWARLTLDRRQQVCYQDIPAHLVNAFVAAEDWTFFCHHGLAFKGMVRAAIVNAYHGRIVQGGSTITQQLVKLLLLDSRKTFVRKVKEQILALIIEYQYSKEQIVQAYLNTVYFGCGIYGIQAAAQRFWNIDASDVSLDQAAVLASIVRCPGAYCPLLCPIETQRRRDTILHKMVRLQSISQVNCDSACQAPLGIVEQCNRRIAPHLFENIRHELEALLGKAAIYTQGFRVYTTINCDMQQTAQQIFTKHIDVLRSSSNQAVDGALVALEPTTGGIKAFVGGYDFSQSQYNRATKARRQIGSIFKPIIYAAAINAGYNFAYTAVDEPLEIRQINAFWKPGNFDGTFRGRMSLAHALSHSNNIVTIKTLLHIGYKPVIEIAQRCGLPGPFRTYPSLALGCTEATAVQAAGMFNSFANHGVYVEPHAIRLIKDASGLVIWRANPKSLPVMSPLVADQVAFVLRKSMERLRRSQPQTMVGSDAIGKTGTTNDWRTCWFVGSTPALTTALYVGRDDNKSMGTNMFPRKTALPIWQAFTKAVEKGAQSFTYDPSLRIVCIDQLTGDLLDDQSDKNALTILL